MKPTFHWSVEQNHLRPRWLAVLDYQQRNISRIQPVPVATFARWRSRAASVAHLRNQKTRPHVHIYFSMVRFQPPLPFPIAIAVYTLCRVFSYDFKEAFEVCAVMKPAREISKEIPAGVEFFFNVTARHRLDFHSRKIFLFSLHWWKKKRNYKMEKKKIKEDVCDVKFIGSRYVIIIRYYYIIIRWYKF